MVNQWARGLRPVPAIKCVAIERVTSRHVTRPELRPTDWMEIWPELADLLAHVLPVDASVVAGD